MRGEWIEIQPLVDGGRRRRRSLPMRGEWIEIVQGWPLLLMASLPMRGEWIEIVGRAGSPGAGRVSPHAGRVD